MNRSRVVLRLLSCALVLGVAACGGGGGGASTSPIIIPPPPPPPPPTGLDPQYLVSATSPFVAGCDRETSVGTLFVNAEVEPLLAVNPRNHDRMVGVYQQDRWSNGSSRGVMAATSLDGGVSWTRSPIPFSRCGGGSALNGGDFARVSNPWVTYAIDGVAHAVGLASSGAIFQAGASSAILASRSVDDGRTWSNPTALILDGSAFFNDKDAVTADPTDGRYVYVVWDRLVNSDNNGATYLARSVNNGATWETARAIYDPGRNSQTIGNVLVVAADGTLVTLFTQIDFGSSTQVARLAVVRSTDKGLTWSAPIVVSDLLAVGTRDPNGGAPVRDAALLAEITTAPNGDLYTVWQDSRFNSGRYDAIALSRSIDGGRTWSTPMRVNAVAGVAAFDPQVHVRSDGVIGVTYYDFRSDTTAAPLLTDTWLARSSDNGASWTETRVSGAFDLANAPLTNAPGAGGYFLGDYQGLASRDNVFLPLFAAANTGNTANRTDIFSAPALSVTAAANRATGGTRAGSAASTGTGIASSRTAQVFHLLPGTRQRISDHLKRARQWRLGSAEAPAAKTPTSPER